MGFGVSLPEAGAGTRGSLRFLAAQNLLQFCGPWLQRAQAQGSAHGSTQPSTVLRAAATQSSSSPAPPWFCASTLLSAPSNALEMLLGAFLCLGWVFAFVILGAAFQTLQNENIFIPRRVYFSSPQSSIDQE